MFKGSSWWKCRNVDRACGVQGKLDTQKKGAFPKCILSLDKSSGELRHSSKPIYAVAATFIAHKTKLGLGPFERLAKARAVTGLAPSAALSLEERHK